MDLKKVRDILLEYLNQKDFKLYDLEYVYESGMKILRVLVSKNGGINIDELAGINHYLSLELDKIDDSEEEYMLEVSSPGAEAILRNEEEIKDHVGSYVHVVTNEQKYEGVLLSFNDGILVIKVNLKGRFKNFEVNYKDINKIRLAVKF